jgi:hypothetical protein
MRTIHLRSIVFPSLLALAAGCATGAGSGGTAPSPGGDAVKARITQLENAGNPAIACLEKAGKTDVGIFEVTADAAGKVAGRAVAWTGAPEVSACILDVANKLTVPAQAGPPVSALWTIRPKDAPPPQPPADAAGVSAAVHEVEGKLGSTDIPGCAQRYLPNDFPANIALHLTIMTGGKAAAVNVMSSTSKDGDFDSCVQKAVAGAAFPDPKSEMGFPIDLAFHVGPVDKL